MLTLDLMIPLLLGGCHGEPPHLPASSAAIARSREVPGGIEVTWLLWDRTQSQPTTLASGTVRVEITDRAVHGPDDVPPACASLPVAFTQDAFERDDGWAVVTSFLLDCPPPPVDADMFRDLSLWVEPSDGPAIQAHDDAPGAYGTALGLRAGLARHRDVAGEAARTLAASVEAKALADKGALLDAMGGSTFSSDCGGVTAALAPRVELVEWSGAARPSAIWVRRQLGRSDAHLVDGPERLSRGTYDGALYLVAGSPPAVVCGAPIHAQTSAAIAVAAAIQDPQTLLVAQPYRLCPRSTVACDLDHEIETATEAVRAGLVGDRLLFTDAR